MSKKSKEADEIKDKSEDVENGPIECEVVEEAQPVEEKSCDEVLDEKLKAAEDKYLRLYAEFDNFRKRTIKEKEAIYVSSISETVSAMLPVIDSLERAISVDGDKEAIKKGMDMVMKQAKDSLAAIKVEEIDTACSFDPNFHNAVMHIDDETLEPQTIMEVYQKGYKIGDKVIRHSIVKVAN